MAKHNDEYLDDAFDICAMVDSETDTSPTNQNSLHSLVANAISNIKEAQQQATSEYDQKLLTAACDTLKDVLGKAAKK